MEEPEKEERIRDIKAALDEGDLQKVDRLCRMALGQWPDDARFHLLIVELALRLKRHAVAATSLQKAAELNYLDVALQLRLLAATKTTAPAAQPRYLLITEWGYGFWSEIGHVLGSLLLAEMTGRTPVVHWGDNCLFSRGDGTDGWTLYFEAVSTVDRGALAVEGLSYFPPPWNADHVLSARADAVRLQRPAGTWGLSLLPQEENVLVSDTWLGINALRRWIEPQHPLHGMSRIALTRYLFDKYIRLKPRLRQQIQAFIDQTLAGRQWLAVHIRGTDKASEQKNLDEVNAQYVPWIDAFLQDHSDWGIFLMTDSEPHWHLMQQRYGRRVISTNSLRSSGKRGIHHSGHNPVRVAVEVIFDTYIAASCQAFIGNGSSNTSLAVEYLKDWPEGAYTLLGLDWRELVISM